MYDSWDDERDDIEKRFQATKHRFARMSSIMPWVITGIFLAMIVSIVVCCCRRCRRNRGVVLTPATVVSVPAPPSGPVSYPQQQYVTPVVTSYPPVQTTNRYVHQPAPYPVTSPYPTGGAPYPTGGAPYPTGGAPYPTGGVPYPTGGAPYPTGGAPYPAGGAPSAPDSNVYLGPVPPLGWQYYVPPPAPPPAPLTHTMLPPTYEVATGGTEPYAKSPPYNPSVPH